MRNGMRFSMILLFMSISLSLLFVGLVHSASDDIPRITIEELKKMVNERADIVILDAQPKAVYSKGHIKGALSLPWAPKLTAAQTANLPRNKPIITYCDCGPGESDSANVATQLMELGFADVRVLKDPSISGWMEAGYPME
jgi:rhodanese-related sulfurtransferase